MKTVNIITLVPLFLNLFILDHINANTILVSNYNELYYVTGNASPGDSIMIANGIYDHDQGTLPVRSSNITIMSQSGNRDSVIINGLDMFDFGYQSGIGIFTTESGDTLHNVTIRDITIKNVGGNCIYSNTDIDSLRIINCKFVDAGEQFIKIRSGPDIFISENGIIENCLFEYSAGTGPQYYIGGVEVRKGKNWIIRKNIFKNIKSPDFTAAQHVITFWNDSENILVEKNLIINCDQGIRFGLDIMGNMGGVIRNNMMYSAGTMGETGISLHTSPGTQVYNNSIFLDDYYMSAIEYRYSETQDIVISNNLTNKEIMPRNGAAGTVENNITDAPEHWFTDVSSGDLHLNCDTLSQVIDQGISIEGLSDDFDGDLRPQGGGIDIGADEYTAPSDIGLENNKNIGSSFNLHQNFPNPFNPKTVISYQLPVSSEVQLSVYNIFGQKVATLVNKKQPPGRYQVEWDASGFASGVYLYRLETSDGYTQSKKLLLLK